jgi:hypothetical protein
VSSVMRLEMKIVSGVAAVASAVRVGKRAAT